MPLLGSLTWPLERCVRATPSFQGDSIPVLMPTCSRNWVMLFHCRLKALFCGFVSTSYRRLVQAMPLPISRLQLNILGEGNDRRREGNIPKPKPSIFGLPKSPKNRFAPNEGCFQYVCQGYLPEERRSRVACRDSPASGAGKSNSGECLMTFPIPADNSRVVGRLFLVICAPASQCISMSAQHQPAFRKGVFLSMTE